MANPKQKHTKSRRNKRRAHIHIGGRSLVSCRKCGKKIMAHTVCNYCGYYKGVEMIDVLKKLTKKERKKKEKEMKDVEKEDKKAKPLDMADLSQK